MPCADAAVTVATGTPIAVVAAAASGRAASAVLLAVSASAAVAKNPVAATDHVGVVDCSRRRDALVCEMRTMRLAAFVMLQRLV